jgi:hypothetical protein
MPCKDAIVVWAGKLRKLWDSLRELRSYLCERRMERTVLRPALLPVKTGQFTQFFRHTLKSLSLVGSLYGAYISLIWRLYSSYMTLITRNNWFWVYSRNQSTKIELAVFLCVHYSWYGMY